jgi:hypothetical protein
MNFLFFDSLLQRVLNAGGHKEMSSILADQYLLVYEPMNAWGKGEGVVGD